MTRSRWGRALATSTNNRAAERAAERKAREYEPDEPATFTPSPELAAAVAAAEAEWSEISNQIHTEQETTE